uniref:Uncharacterized protein n=1 Tax=Oryza meridionalis TaxID=40149 RepID=A0A0E0CV30_9ORYZ
MRRGSRGHGPSPCAPAGWVTAMAHVKKPREKPGHQIAPQHSTDPRRRTARCGFQPCWCAPSLWICFAYNNSNAVLQNCSIGRSAAAISGSAAAALHHLPLLKCWPPSMTASETDDDLCNHPTSPSSETTTAVSVSLTSDDCIFFMKENEGKGEEQKQMI